MLGRGRNRMVERGHLAGDHPGVSMGLDTEADCPVHRVRVMGDKQSEVPTAKGAPAAETLARTEEARQLLRALAARDSMGRPMAFGPGVPSDRVQAVRKALDQTARDPR